MIEYKGYVATVEFDADIEAFHGSVLNTRDVISFYGASVDELKREMAASVEEYLAFCRERGAEPEKPFSGKFMVRADPELHREVATIAAARGKSMNEWVTDTLAEAVRAADIETASAEATYHGTRGARREVAEKPDPDRGHGAG